MSYSGHTVARMFGKERRSGPVDDPLPRTKNFYFDEFSVIWYLNCLLSTTGPEDTIKFICCVCLGQNNEFAFTAVTFTKKFKG